MGLMQTVAGMVTERGQASADDLLPMLEGYTREQVIRAMQNAAHARLIVAAQHGEAAHRGGRLPSFYRAVVVAQKPVPKPAPVPQRARVASVWDYAQK